MDPLDCQPSAYPESVGPFTLIEQIGQGGMGMVYRARDERLGREVALKLLPRMVSDDPQRRSRFEREARAAASLKHPAIATIYEFGEETDDAGNSQLYLAMELVEGRDLASVLHRQQLSIQAIVNIATDIVMGLREAHRHGIVHRDLKPGNIRISNEGEVKILDFGLAKMLTDENSAADDMSTRTGSVMGTIPYMAPEQVRGEAIDARTDLFAFGVILYKMISGESPYAATNIAQFVLDLERAQPTPIEELRPETPPELSSLISKLLQKAPDDRPKNATEVLESLGGMSSEPVTLISEQISQRHLPARQWTLWGESLPKHTLRLAAAGALVLVLAALALWLLRGVSAETQQRLAVVPFRNLTGDPEAEYLAEGLATLLRSRLSALPELRVVGQEATLGFLETAADDQTGYAKRLRLSGILEGSLQRSADQLLIVVNFVEPLSQTTLWSTEFPATEAGMPRVPVEIAREVATRLFGTAPEAVAAEALPAPETFEGFLRAMETLVAPSDSSSIRTAIALLQQTIDETPSFGPAHLELAKGYLMLYNSEPEPRMLEDAEQAAQEAARLEPGLPEVKVVLARVLLAREEVDQAIALLEETLEERPDEEKLLAQLEASFAAAGNSTLAGETFARLEKLSDPQAVARELAWAYDRSGNLGKAEELLRSAVAEQPDNSVSLRQLGSFLLQQNRFDEAISFIDRALELSPKQPEALGNLGAARLFTGDVLGAIEAFDRLDPPILDPLIASNMGTAHYMLGQIDEAERLYRLGSLLDPNDPTLRGNHGDALLQLGQTAEARQEYSTALDLVRNQRRYFPNDPGLRSNEVLFLAKSDQCSESGALIEEAEAAFAQNPSGLHRLARSAALCRDREASLRLLGKTIAAGIPFDTIKQLDDEFRYLEGDPEYEALGSQ